MSLRESLFCPVCGLKQSEPFFDRDGNPNWETCVCCGFMAGHTDDSIEGIKRLRRHWIEKEKAHWFHPEKKPPDWSLEKQLERIPPEFS